METTILIKTFQRPQAVLRLYDSIRQYYPTIPVVIVDDSNNGISEFYNPQDNLTYLKTEFDIGLSRGRNLGVELVKTKYVLTCDDDCIFTENTNIQELEKMMSDWYWLDILGIDAGVGYCGCFETKGDTVIYHSDDKGVKPGVAFYDFVPNIFIAKTDSLKQYKWREELKMGEHFAYFYDHLGKINVAITRQVTMKHEHINAVGYDNYRSRALEYVKQYMRSKGIGRRITFDGIDIA